MTCADHKGKGHNEEQSEMMKENFQPPGGAACAAQSAWRLPRTSARTPHANKFLNKNNIN
jgi:hypothetical protein